MTNQEAIKGLKGLAKEFSGYKPNEEMFDMAIEAIEKQIPMKPLSPDVDAYGKVITPCGNCGEAIDPIQDYCPWCGQKH